MVTNYATWMKETPGLLNKRLYEIALPGSYQSASYQLEYRKVCDHPSLLLNAAWKGDNRFDDCGEWEMITLDLFARYVRANNARNDLYPKWCTTQRRPLLSQLTAGARYLDLEVCYWAGDKDIPAGIYACNMMLGPSIGVLLSDIAQFMGMVTQELVVVHLRGFHNFGAGGTNQHVALLNQINATLGQYLHRRRIVDDSLNHLTIGEILAPGARVVVIYDDICVRPDRALFYAAGQTVVGKPILEDPALADDKTSMHVWPGTQVRVLTGPYDRNDTSRISQNSELKLRRAPGDARSLAILPWSRNPTNEAVGRSALDMIGDTHRINPKSKDEGAYDTALLLSGLESDSPRNMEAYSHGVNEEALVFVGKNRDYTMNTFLVNFFNEGTNATRLIDMCILITNGGQALDPDLVGQSLAFNGTTSVIKLPELQLDASRGLTIEAWLLATQFRDGARLIELGSSDRADDICLLMRQASATASPSFELQLAKSGESFSMSVGSGKRTYQWIHVAAVIKPDGSGHLLVDGIPSTSVNMPLPRNVKRTSNLIGGSARSQPSFQGRMAEVRLWNTARTDDEVRAEMYRRLTGLEDGLVGCWRLNERDTASAGDCSRFGRHGVGVSGLAVPSGPLATGGRFVTLRSANYSTHFLRSVGQYANLATARDDGERREATFRVVTGLADPTKISLESATDPNLYLRHQNGRLVLSLMSTDALFCADATFKLVPGLAGGATCSLQSHNFPGCYVRHRNGTFWCDPLEAGNALYQGDASFTLDAPQYPALAMVSLCGVRFRADSTGIIRQTEPSRQALRHRNGALVCTGISSATDRKDATFRLVQGLADPALISIESVNFPRCYIAFDERDAVRLLPDLGTEAFRQRATFKLEADGGISRTGTYSFETVFHAKDPQWVGIRYFLVNSGGEVIVNSPMAPMTGAFGLEDCCFLALGDYWPR